MAVNPLPAALDQLLNKLIAIAGVPLPARPYLNFVTGATAVDNPTFVDPNGDVVGSTDVTVSGGGGGGGPVYLPTSTFSSHPAPAAAAQNVLPINSSGGSFVQPFPTGSAVGNEIEFDDTWGIGVGTGINVNPVTLADTIPVQDPHTGSIGSDSYVWGSNGADAGGGTLTYRKTNDPVRGLYWKFIG
jgi:hypothetical protein